jgi:hypothetical protein
LQAAFFIRQLHYRIRARNVVVFGPSGAANKIRGALGEKLRQQKAVYARLFRPVQTGKGPSGLADSPRPLVLRAAHLDGLRFEPGETYSFCVHLFETGAKAVEATRALDAAFDASSEVQEVEIDFTAPLDKISRIQVAFVTPMELKSGGETVDHATFPILFARVRDRVATLQALYGAGAFEVDFSLLGQRAQQVATVECDLQRVDRSRRSSRTGQTHSLGGFTGHAIYSGKLDEFGPWLRAAEWTGVGRQTVWGKGQIRLTIL